MAARAYWKGYLKLSLVSCPIVLSPATSGSEKVSFHRINKDTGNRLRQQLIDEETGEPVEREKVGRGYEVGSSMTGIAPLETETVICREGTHRNRPIMVRISAKGRDRTSLP